MAAHLPKAKSLQGLPIGFRCRSVTFVSSNGLVYDVFYFFFSKFPILVLEKKKKNQKQTKKTEKKNISVQLFDGGEDDVVLT